ncbi:MAG: RluA family pseudouridine synthase [Chloroflexi bacterium]|nr:RluA family pseudouridine synthase [Chloroflexota bacterium]
MPTARFKFEGPGEKRRLDVCVADGVPDISRSTAQRLVREGAVAVNGAIEMRPSHAVTPGAEIRVELPAPPGDTELLASHQQFEIAWEDGHLLIVDKPSGLSVHPGPGHESDTLVNGLLARFPEIRGVGEHDRPGIVHRLDRDTSGLMLVARTGRAHALLTEAIRERRVRRHYTALVRGGPETDAGVIDAPLGRDPHNRQRQAIVEDGREARTRFSVLERLSRTTLLGVELETGRTHQIRIHLSSIGHPVCGDAVYGRAAKGPGGLGRQFLHASGLSFTHPVSGEEIQLESPLPEDLQSSLDAARRE